ncbi:MAG: bifunctional 5,10-methylenetetrahydrofolate dehydrogenase/5,10-methenyltetrahydrofolate cyclohydrolase [Bryobacteraceae bacterium]
MPNILNGSLIRDEILNECRPRVAALPRPPGLAVILAGDNPASAIYVRNKVKACADLGVYSEKHTPSGDVTTGQLLSLIGDLNQRPEIDGILVQMPLPSQVDAKKVLLAVSPAKDVDGFHPCNLGNLVTGRPGPVACTPAGILELLKRYRIPIAGRRAVVVGRSDIVGKPMALLLLHQDATVTVCHSKTPDLPAVARQADILVAALGRPAMLTADYIAEGATVVDVGINRILERSEAVRIFGEASDRVAAFDRNGSVLAGDVHPDAVSRAGAYTPVPGGVGPLTIAMLMVNTIRSAESRLGAC